MVRLLGISGHYKAAHFGHALTAAAIRRGAQSIDIARYSALIRRMARSNYSKWLLAAFASAVGLVAYRQYRAARTLAIAHPYQIDTSQLQAGDILLYRTKKTSVMSAMVRWRTSSPYSHAAIYLGDGKILEAVVPRVRIAPLKVPTRGYIGVIRSQCGFGPERQEILRDFAAQLVTNKTRYDLRGVLEFVGIRRDEYWKNVQAIIDGASSVKGDERTKYFCSALVARIWCIVGIADESAWYVFLQDLVSPGGIVGDVNFGWFLGYLVPPGVTVPDSDPLQQTTAWKDVMAAAPAP